MSDKKVMHLPLWLMNNEEDPFADYCGRGRADLPMADFSDDQLANFAFMNYDRDQSAEFAAIMSMGKYPTKIVFMTAVKERIRWLSRQLLIAEGKYPGKEKPLQIDAEKVWEFVKDEYVGHSEDAIRVACGGLFPEEFLEAKLQELPSEEDESVIQAKRKDFFSEVLSSRRDDIEKRAQEIYESWCDQPGYQPWVPGGNSLKQGEARSQAHAERADAINQLMGGAGRFLQCPDYKASSSFGTWPGNPLLDESLLDTTQVNPYDFHSDKLISEDGYVLRDKNGPSGIFVGSRTQKEQVLRHEPLTPSVVKVANQVTTPPSNPLPLDKAGIKEVARSISNLARLAKGVKSDDSKKQ